MRLRDGAAMRLRDGAAMASCAVGLFLWVAPAMGQTPVLVYDGVTEPEHDILVAAMEIGRLDSVSIRVGDQVSEGQVIAKLEDSLQVTALKIARIQAGMSGEVATASADVSLQEQRVKGLEKLSQEKMTRPDELARARMELAMSQGKLATAQEQAELRLAEVERYELQVERRLVRAPMSGTITEVIHDKGEYLTPSDAAVARLVVTDKIYAVFSIPVEEASKFNVGTGVLVYLRSISQTIGSSIESMSTEIDGESGTVQVRVPLPNPEGNLRIGDRCTLRLMPAGYQAASSSEPRSSNRR